MARHREGPARSAPDRTRTNRRRHRAARSRQSPKAKRAAPGWACAPPVSVLAHALARAGRWQEATSRYDEALASIEATGEGFFEPMVRQGYGEFLLARDGAAGAGAAEACITKALELARAQGARWWELRAAVSLARLMHSQGRAREAHELLAPVYGWFTEGFDTRRPEGGSGTARRVGRAVKCGLLTLVAPVRVLSHRSIAISH